jgi:diguanylate cyclase (GGDEF)-like protein
VSLRSRLWLVIGVIVLLPLVVVGTLATVAAPTFLASSREEALRLTADAVTAGLRTECLSVGVEARYVAVEAAARPDPVAAVREIRLEKRRYAALIDASGRSLVERGERPPGLGEPARAARCSDSGAGTSALAQTVDVTAPAKGLARGSRALVAEPVDAELLRQVSGGRTADTSVSLVADGRVVASTRPDWERAVSSIAAQGGSGVEAGGLVGLVRRPTEGAPWTVVVAVERPSTAVLQRSLAAAALAAILLSLLIGWRIARSLTHPIEELGDAATRVARGELDLRVPVRRRDEVGLLGEKFNDMTVELQRTIAALERSRDEMAENLRRLGETLSNTHELDKLMPLVLETAMTMVDADAGAAYLRDGQGFRLAADRCLADLGVTAPVQQPPLEAGVLGAVTISGAPVRGRLGSRLDELPPGPGEPAQAQVLASLLTSRRGGADYVVGALVLYRRPSAPEFAGAQEEALRALAAQAASAVDNVNLHRDAERLAITDPLTGSWNFRYLSMSLAREIERANRFERPLAVLMLDLDHFKQVNDTYGHARGDAVLREFAARITEQVREVDTLARYGGEEFVLVLPETTPDGAAMLADASARRSAGRPSASTTVSRRCTSRCRSASRLPAARR